MQKAQDSYTILCQLGKAGVVCQRQIYFQMQQSYEKDCDENQNIIKKMNRFKCIFQKFFADKCCEMNVTFADKSIVPVPSDLSTNCSLLKCRKCFTGFDSLQNNPDLLDIVVEILIQLIFYCKEFKVSKENLFLLK